ncbi:MAG: sugar phosphate isomerase/epimerase [Agathobacter sp.]|nr:sugar phosphate isomerase/epimerase [Agathobacter sp.]
MLQIGMQTRNIVLDENPLEGFQLIKEAGFDCADFSLNGYLPNKMVYKGQVNGIFDKTVEELEVFFTPHKEAAKQAGIRIHQMHMPYPLHVPNGKKEINDYLWNVVAPKSLHVCKFFDCKYIVVHGFKLATYLGSEELEWAETEKFLRFLAPMAKEMGITLCVENLYNSLGNHMGEGPCCDVEKVVKRIDALNEEFGAEVFGFCLDVGHAHLVGIDIYDFIVRLGRRLKVLHVHDNDGVRDLHQIPYTFTKTRENKPSTDWDGFLEGLREIEFDGVINFEASPVVSAFPEEMKADALEFLVKIGKYFVSKI